MVITRWNQLCGISYLCDLKEYSPIHESNVQKSEVNQLENYMPS